MAVLASESSGVATIRARAMVLILVALVSACGVVPVAQTPSPSRSAPPTSQSPSPGRLSNPTPSLGPGASACPAYAANYPAPRADAGIAYDEKDGYLLMFGGMSYISDAGCLRCS